MSDDGTGAGSEPSGCRSSGTATCGRSLQQRYEGAKRCWLRNGALRDCIVVWGIQCSQTGHSPGVDPIAIGNPAVDQSLHDPGYSLAVARPAASMARMLWQAVTPLPQ